MMPGINVASRDRQITRQMAMFHGLYILMLPIVLTVADKGLASSISQDFRNASLHRITDDTEPETPNFLRDECNTIRISDCTYLYSMSTSDENQVDWKKNCTFFDIASLNSILRNQHLEMSINQDCILNHTSSPGSNYITLLLSIGNVNSSDVALDHLHDYVEEKHNEINVNSQTSSQETNTFEIQNQSVPSEISTAGTALNDLKEVKTLLNSLKNIQTIILNSIDLESFGAGVHNLSEDFLTDRSYEKGALAVEESEEYLKELEMESQSVKNFNRLLEIQNFSILLDIPWVRCLLTVKRWEKEVSAERQRHTEVVDTFRKVKAFSIFQDYVDPAVYFIILLVGLVWNGVLILMFAMHKQLWTPPNVMLFNLAVADILSLILNLLLFYFAHYYVSNFQKNEYVCKFYVTVRPLSVALSALSVVALSMLRYFATGKSFALHSKQVLCNLTTRTRIVFYVSAVWVIAFGLATPYSFLIMFSKGMCFKYGDGHVAKMVTLFEFLFYCVLLPITVVVFNSLTARSIRQSTKNLTATLKHNGHDQIRNRSANVLMSLVIVFLISYVPHYLWRVLHRWLELDIWEVPYRSADKITYYLLFANCCFNPISLYIVSGTFRKLFNYYFFYFYNKYSVKIENPRLGRLSDSSLHMNAIRTRY